MADEREPALDHDPRDQESAGAGYPETQPEGHDPSGGEGGASEGGGEGPPSNRSPQEGDAGQATGNPDAAG
jgi:hypothetical protein